MWKFVQFPASFLSIIIQLKIQEAQESQRLYVIQTQQSWAEFPLKP